MADVLENILGQLSKWGEIVVDKSGFYFKKAIDKSEELSKIGRIQLDIEKVKRKVKQNLAELGKFVYDEVQNNSVEDLSNNLEFKKFIEEIDAGKTELEELDALKKEVKRKEEESDEGSKAEEEPDIEIDDILDTVTNDDGPEPEKPKS